MDNAKDTLTLESARAQGAAWFPKFGMAQAFVVAACASDLDTADLMDAFNAGKASAQREAANAALRATGEFSDLPSLKR